MDQTRQHIILLVVLLFFYCVPIIFLFGYYVYLVVTSGSSHPLEFDAAQPAFVLKSVFEVASKPGNYLNIVHQMILPVIAAVTAASRKDVLDQGTFRLVFLVPLITIFVCIALAIGFQIHSNHAQKELASQLFLNFAQNLSIYVMLLVGLRLSDGKP